MPAESAVGGEGVHLGVADFDAGGVDAVVEFGVYFQPSLGGCGADEVDDGWVAAEGASAPVHGDVVEESVLDLVRKCRVVPDAKMSVVIPLGGAPRWPAVDGGRRSCLARI